MAALCPVRWRWWRRRWRLVVVEDEVREPSGGHGVAVDVRDRHDRVDCSTVAWTAPQLVAALLEASWVARRC